MWTIRFFSEGQTQNIKDMLTILPGSNPSIVLHTAQWWVSRLELYIKACYAYALPGTIQPWLHPASPPTLQLGYFTDLFAAHFLEIPLF
jgi:hypothetical protein